MIGQITSKNELVKWQNIIFFRLLPSQYIKRAALLFTLLSLGNCTGLGYTPPPVAKLGDAFLTLTVSTDKRYRMPQGADIVISIENEKAKDPEKRVIIGDVVKLSLSDTIVKVNFPIDRAKLAKCGKQMQCQIHVKVMKNGFERFKSNEQLTYKAGQTSAAIKVSKSS